MEETKGRNDLIRGLNGGILQKRSTSPTEGALLDKSGHSVDRGLREGIGGIDGILRHVASPSWQSPGSRDHPGDR